MIFWEGLDAFLRAATALLIEEADGNPRHCGDQDRADEQGEDVADHRLDAFVGVDAADGAGRVIADAEWWREQPDTHREDHHHRVMNFMHADLLGDREQERTEQHDGRYALKHTAEHYERDDRDGKKYRRATGKSGHELG